MPFCSANPIRKCHSGMEETLEDLQVKSFQSQINSLYGNHLETEHKGWLMCDWYIDYDFGYVCLLV